MSYSIVEIANALGAKYVGDGTLRVTNASEPIDSDVNSLALAMSDKYCLDLASGGSKSSSFTSWHALERTGFVGCDFNR